MKKRTTTETAPFTVLVDSREKAPYTFDGIEGERIEGVEVLNAGSFDELPTHRRVIVPTEWRYLQTGDYSIDGYEDRVAVERKSLADLYSTLGQNRERFEREHERLAELDRAAVVIEAGYRQAILRPPERSELNPKTVFRTAAAWHARYGVAWLFLDSRRLAEQFTYRFLSKYWEKVRNG